MDGYSVPLFFMFLGKRQADQPAEHLLPRSDTAAAEALGACLQPKPDQPQPVRRGECRDEARQEAQGKDVQERLNKCKLNTQGENPGMSLKSNPNF